MRTETEELKPEMAVVNTEMTSPSSGSTPTWTQNTESSKCCPPKVHWKNCMLASRVLNPLQAVGRSI